MYSKAILAACLLVTASAAVVNPSHVQLKPLEAQSHIATSAHFLKKDDRPNDLSLLRTGTVASMLGTGAMTYFACGSEGCQLLGGFGLFVQFLLWAAVMGCLGFKWCFERPQRSFHVFVLDVGKLGFGTTYIHMVNLIQAHYFAEYAKILSHNNQCAWYLVGMFCDCGISTILCYYAVEYFVRPALRRYSIEFGVYTSDGTRGSVFRSWVWQSLIWCAVITVARALIAVAIWEMQGTVYACAMWVLAPAQGQARAQLVIALVVVPLIADIFQIWVQDSILKAPAKTDGFPNWTAEDFDDTLKPRSFEATFSPERRPIEHFDDQLKPRPAG